MWEEKKVESGGVMKMGRVCLSMRRGGEEAGGWGARSASSEDLLGTGMQEECWQPPEEESEALWVG